MVGRRALALCTALAAALGLAACGSSANHASAGQGATGTPSSASASTAQAAGACHYVAGGSAARKVGLPPATPKRATKLVLAMHVGSSSTPQPIDITLDPSTAPCTVNSIAFLAGAKYFDNTKCQRLTTQGRVVLQCGDPTGTGSGGPGYSFADELSGSEKYPAGTVAMANAGPNTNGSQFFLVYADTSLPPSYTVFGRITAGLAVLQREARGGAVSQNGPGDGPPRIPIGIATATAG
jgi:peptidyl-prolyl cis-trans isomerase B (cyclophilin B)